MDYRDPEQAVPLLPAANGAGAQQQQSQRQLARKTEGKRSKLLTVCPFILGNEFCERLAYYGLATNLVTYLTHIMGVDAAAAAVQVMVFEGTCYVTPLLGAYLADSHWGRYKTILVFSTIYLCGCVLLTATSGLPGLTPGPYDDATWLQSAALFGALGVIALGTGGIKPNVSAFGADQFDEADPQDKREKESFFNWFYLAINIGSLIACTVIVYVQDQVSWTVGFALPASAMATAVLLFLAGSKHYRHVAPTESPMARVVKVVAAALHNRWRGNNSSSRGGNKHSSSIGSNGLIAGGSGSSTPEPKPWGGGGVGGRSGGDVTQPLLIPAAAGASSASAAVAAGAGAGAGGMRGVAGAGGVPVLVGSAGHGGGLPTGPFGTPGSIISASPRSQRVSFYQRQQQQQQHQPGVQQNHQVVYGFSPEPNSQQQQQQQAPWEVLSGGVAGGGGGPANNSSMSSGGGSSSSSLTRPPRPLLGGGSSPSPQPHQMLQQANRPAGGAGAGGGVGSRTASFSWLEAAINDWQTAQQQQEGQQQQQQQQHQQPHLQQAGGALVSAAAGAGRSGSSSGRAVVVSSGGAAGGAGGYSAKQVEEVKMVLRLLPVFATTVIYWTIYSMMGTFFIQQGSLMDNSIPLPAFLGGGGGGDCGLSSSSSGSGSSGSSGSSGDSSSGGACLHIPAATMALFNTGAIILLVPLYDAFLEPAIKAAGVKWTLLRRIGWGMVISVLAMFYAAVVERWRLDIYQSMTSGSSIGSSSVGSVFVGSSSSSGGGDDPSGGGGGGGGFGPAVVPLSIMWQAPAYMLVGASEVLASIAQLEFFYDQAPDVMRSCSMALQLLSTALGSYLGGGLVAAVAASTSAAGHPWLPKDLNVGHLDLFLWLCGGLMLGNTLLFVLVANGYEYKTVEHVVLVQVQDEEEEAALTLGGMVPGRLPPRAPSPASSLLQQQQQRRAGAAIAINASAARRSQYHYAAQEEGEGDEEGQLYSRSLAFVPASPALPAPFR